MHLLQRGSAVQSVNAKQQRRPSAAAAPLVVRAVAEPATRPAEAAKRNGSGNGNGKPKPAHFINVIAKTAWEKGIPPGMVRGGRRRRRYVLGGERVREARGGRAAPRLRAAAAAPGAGPRAQERSCRRPRWRSPRQTRRLPLSRPDARPRPVPPIETDRERT
jgi:hypothetical protein